jgi:hypothetical protein
MGFSYRVGKGVRVRVSSRGLRTSIGPRSARLHVGAGRTGVSTGAGPVTYYTSVGGRRGRSAGSQIVRASQRQLSQAHKAEKAEVLASAVQHILTSHRQVFPRCRSTGRPAAPCRALAEFERDLIRERSWLDRRRPAAEARATAVAELTVVDIAKTLGLSRASVYRHRARDSTG